MQDILSSPGRRAALMRLQALMAATAIPISARGASYPSQPITLLVPFGPGGAAQALTQRLAPGMLDVLGKPIVNEYRGGAGGIIAGESLARAEPNGYTLLLATPSVLAAVPAVRKSVKYDPLKDFAPVVSIATSPLVLAVNSKVPVSTMQEFVAYAKAHPRKLNMGSAGVGSMEHVGTEILQKMAGIELVHVPYKGPGASLQDLAADRLDCVFSSPIPVAPYVQAGTAKILAVTSSQRSPALPNIPTIAEAGYPSFVMDNWYALVAPTGTPAAIISRINGAVRKTLEDPGVLEYLSSFGLVPSASTPEAFGATLRHDVEHWRDWAQRSGVQVE